MSSIYSSPGSSRVRVAFTAIVPMQLTEAQRVSHATNPESPSQCQPLHVNSTSDGIEDLLERHTETTRLEQHAEPHTLWQRRKSARSTEGVPLDAVDAFHLELLEAYEDDQDQQDLLPSPPLSALPPRMSSLARRPLPQRTLSLEHQTTSQSTDHRPPAPILGTRQSRPQPIVIPELGSVETQEPQVQSARLAPTPSFLETDPSEGTFRKRHRRRMTISESKRAARGTIIVSHPSGVLREHDLHSVPGLSPSTSIATSALSPVPATPPSAVAARSEDQIRRELEMLTLQDGADPLITHRYGGRVDSELVMKLERQAEGDHDPASIDYRAGRLRPERTPPDNSFARRRKSIVEYFGRRSPVDKLLDLYLDDDDGVPEKPAKAEKAAESPPEKTPMKRRQSLARRMTLTFRGSPKDDMPPLPPQIPAGMI